MEDSNIYYNAMPASNIGWMIFWSQEFSVFEKKVSEQRWGKKCPLIIWNSSSHRFIKTLWCRHNVVLCLLHNLSANSVWLRASLSQHTSHTSYLPSGSGQLFVALCSPRIYRLSLSYRDLLTVMSVLGFHILYSSNIKTVSKYNWILNVYSNLSVGPGPSS